MCIAVPLMNVVPTVSACLPFIRCSCRTGKLHLEEIPQRCHVKRRVQQLRSGERRGWHLFKIGSSDGIPDKCEHWGCLASRFHLQGPLTPLQLQTVLNKSRLSQSRQLASDSGTRIPCACRCGISCESVKDGQRESRVFCVHACESCHV